MKGKIFITGIGPGSRELLTPEAKVSIFNAHVIVGYKTYIHLIEDLIQDKQIISNGMRKEKERCGAAIEKALEGNIVTVISSGDSGIYGMAGLVYEMAGEAAIEIQVVPGVSASNAAAALLGAPLMHDFATISLSDLLTELPVIEKRIEYAAKGDFVICLYNPMSKTRKEPFNRCYDILQTALKPETPVGMVRNAYRENQEVVITYLNKLKEHTIDMVTVLIIGNSQTKIINGKMVTPRGYRV